VIYVTLSWQNPGAYLQQDCFAWGEAFLFRHNSTFKIEWLSLISKCEEQLIEFI